MLCVESVVLFFLDKKYGPCDIARPVRIAPRGIEPLFSG
jgi:hypothetical protein